MNMRNRLLNVLGPLIGLFLFLAALWVLHRSTAAYHYRDIADAVRSVTAERLAAAILLMVLNYLILTRLKGICIASVWSRCRTKRSVR